MKLPQAKSLISDIDGSDGTPKLLDCRLPAKVLPRPRHHADSNEAATTQNTFDYETEYGINPQDIPCITLLDLIKREGLK